MSQNRKPEKNLSIAEEGGKDENYSTHAIK